MPFISKDWRSPGEQWVKIGPGQYERAKVLNYLTSSYFQNRDIGKDEPMQPQYNITTRTTKEIRRQNTLSEALLQLDFYSACHDVRRFNYTCRMIQLLLLNMNYLPGNVQRILMKLIEETSAYARENGWKGEVRQVLQSMRENIDNQPVWGGQLGSSKLWEEHKMQIQRILSSDTSNEDTVPPLQEFPEEVIRQVILKLSCDKDIEALANSNLLFGRISDENRVWRQLCNYHFSPQQIQLIHDQLIIKLQDQKKNRPNWNSRYHRHHRHFRNANNHQSDTETDITENNEADDNSNVVVGENEEYICHPHWKLKFKALKRRYGLSKEEYAEELNLCKSCGVLFWSGKEEHYPHHDCNFGFPILTPVKPGDFIKYFCV